MIVFQGQHFDSFNFIKMHASKKLKLFCVIDWKYKASYSFGWNSAIIGWVWLLIHKVLILCYFFFPRESQISTFPKYSVHLEIYIFVCKFTFANIKMHICIFKCSICQNPFPIDINIHIIMLSASGLFPPLSGTKLSAAEHNSPFVVGWMLP